MLQRLKYFESCVAVKVLRAQIRYQIWRMGLSTKGKSWEDIDTGLLRLKAFIEGCVARGDERKAVHAFVQYSHPEWRSFIFDLPIRRRKWWEKWVFHDKPIKV